MNASKKKRVDDCSDIGVSELPDPKALIEQITTALIRKFMDDIDKEAVELGGTAKFFSNYTLPDPEHPDDPTKTKNEPRVPSETSKPHNQQKVPRARGTFCCE